MPRLPGRVGVLCVAAALSAGLLTAGCSGSGGPGSVGGLEKTTLKVAAVPAMDSAGLYIAQQRGYFAQEGLHVQILPATSSADVIKQQLAGGWDITAGAYPSYIVADEKQHANLKVLVAGSTMAPNVQEIVVPAGSGITKMSQLTGQTVTLNAKGNIGQLLVESMLQDNAVNGNVKFNVQPFPAMGPLLFQHKLTAAWLPEPFISEDEEKYGVQPLADANQGAAESLPIEGYVATQSWLNKYPHTAEAFKIALEKGQAVAAGNLQAVQQSMTAFAKVPKLAASVLPSPGFPVNTQAGPLQRVISLMVDLRLLGEGYNAENLIAKIPNP
jgi:NitT/TauT family transport system substrate-binding protein